MAKQNYFDHTDLNGNSPFDRLKSDNIDFNAAGENLAYGQVDSIYDLSLSNGELPFKSV